MDSYAPLGATPFPVRRGRSGPGGAILLAAGIVAILLVLVLTVVVVHAEAVRHPHLLPIGLVVGLGGGVLLLLLVLLFLAVVVRLVFFALRGGRWGGRPGWGHPPYDRAGRIARIRYARGEISREQFEQIMRDLSAPAGPLPR